MKPTKCCEMGTYKCQIPMPIKGRRRDIDFCIADIVAALNAANIITIASCCGHGKTEAIISLEDGRTLKILTPDSADEKCLCSEPENNLPPYGDICVGCGKPIRR